MIMIGKFQGRAMSRPSESARTINVQYVARQEQGFNQENKTSYPQAKPSTVWCHHPTTGLQHRATPG